MSQSELLSLADGVGEELMLSYSSTSYNVRARGVVLVGRSECVGLVYGYMGAWVELYRMVKKAI